MRTYQISCRKATGLLVFFCRRYRLLAYENFTSWVHDRLGPGIRKVILSCVVSEIRSNFPEETGLYTGYIEGDEDEAEYGAGWILEL